MVEGYVIATSTLYASPLSSFLINTTFIFNLKRVKHSHPFFSRTCQIINPHSKSFNMGCELEDVFIKKTQENCFIANQKPTSMQKTNTVFFISADYHKIREEIRWIKF